MTKKAKPVLLDEDGYLTINPDGKGGGGGGDCPNIVEISANSISSNNASPTLVDDSEAIEAILDLIDKGISPVLKVIDGNSQFTYFANLVYYNSANNSKSYMFSGAMLTENSSFSRGYLSGLVSAEVPTSESSFSKIKLVASLGNGYVTVGYPGD